jgi:hypothetical protein
MKIKYKKQKKKVEGQKTKSKLEGKWQLNVEETTIDIKGSIIE